MQVTSLGIPKSQQDFVAALAAEVLRGETFVLLSGESGSGRTMLLERTVNACDGKLRAIFIPCTSELKLKQLREIFLRQLLPGGDFDSDKPLEESLGKIEYTLPERILCVVDDADKVVNTFYTELTKVFIGSLGQNRYSFVLSGHPLWAQEKRKRTKGDFRPVEMCVPALSLDEAMNLTGAIFKSRELDFLYKAIEKQLPSQLESCEGNPSRILKLTEKLMSEPNAAGQASQNAADGAAAQPKQKKKKRGIVAVFITVICIIIVLACLVPLFLGSSFFSGSKEGASGQAAVETAAQAGDDADGQVIDPFANPSPAGDDEGGLMGGSDLSGGPGGATGAAAAAKATVGTPGNDFAALIAPAPKGTASEAALDDAPLLNDVGGGVEAETPAATTSKSVTLSGDALDKIEQAGAESKGSDRLRPGVAGSLTENPDGAKAETGAADPAAQPQAEPAAPAAQDGAPAPSADPAVITRADNALRAEEIKQEDEADEAERRVVEERAAAAVKAEAEARVKAEQEAALQARQTAAAIAVAKDAENNAASASRPAQSAAAQPTRRGSALPVTGKVMPNDVPSSGQAIPGARAEIDGKDNSRFTLQVVSGRNRDSVVEVSAAVSGRYWIYETVREGRPWFVLITGDYATAAEAVRSAQSLPAQARRAGPFAKSFGTVKEEMTRR